MRRKDEHHCTDPKKHTAHDCAGDTQQLFLMGGANRAERGQKARVLFVETLHVYITQLPADQNGLADRDVEDTAVKATYRSGAAASFHQAAQVRHILSGN